jgi:hypothetical protein
VKPKFTATGDGLEKLRALAKQLEVRPEIHLGVLGGVGGQAAPGSNLTMAELAAIHEFGAPRAGVPERSWLRSTADAKRREWLALLERTLTLAVRGRIDVGAALELVGQRAVADVQKKIRSNIPPPLAQATIDRKGSSVALIDTGRFVQSISYEVVSGRQSGR